MSCRTRILAFLSYGFQKLILIKEEILGRVRFIVTMLSGDIILFPDEYNSILIKTEINVLVIPKHRSMSERRKGAQGLLE